MLSSSSESNGLASASSNCAHALVHAPAHVHSLEYARAMDHRSKSLPRFFIPGINGRARCLMGSDDESGESATVPVVPSKGGGGAGMKKSSASQSSHESFGSSPPTRQEANADFDSDANLIIVANANAHEHVHEQENENDNSRTHSISHNANADSSKCLCEPQLQQDADEKKKRRKKSSDERRERIQPSQLKKRKGKPSLSRKTTKSREADDPLLPSKRSVVDHDIVDRLSVTLSRYASFAQTHPTEKELKPRHVQCDAECDGRLKSPQTFGTGVTPLMEMMQGQDLAYRSRSDSNEAVTPVSSEEPQHSIDRVKDAIASGCFNNSLSFIEQDRTAGNTTDASDAFSLAKMLHDSILQRHTQAPRQNSLSPGAGAYQCTEAPLTSMQDLDAQDILAASCLSPQGKTSLSSLLVNSDSCSLDPEELSAPPVIDIMSSRATDIGPMERLYSSMTFTSFDFPREENDVNLRFHSSAPVMKKDRKLRKHASELPSLPLLNAISGDEKKKHKRSLRHHQKVADDALPSKAIQSSRKVSNAFDVGAVLAAADDRKRNHKLERHARATF